MGRENKIDSDIDRQTECCKFHAKLRGGERNMRIDFCTINFMQGHLQWYGRACVSISIYGQKKHL